MKVIIIRRRTLFVILLIFIGILGYLIMDNKEEATLSYNPILNKVIAVDPGHGGIDPGALGSVGKDEDDINLQIALNLRRLIEQSGGIAILTREDDSGLYTENSPTIRAKKNEDLRNRRILINKSEPDVFITIHLNSFGQSQYYGAQTFYKKGCVKSKALACLVQEEFKRVLDKNNERVPQARDNIYLVRKSEAPSILAECGFLSNPREEQRLNDPKYQEKIAWGLYLGLMRYFSEIEE